MLKIDVPDIDLYDEDKNEFVTIKGQTLCLEHSLVSISKWESKWKKYFIDTATWFAKGKGSYSREIFTSEKIYAQMVILQIPFECQKWHINRLLTLIRVCNEMNNPKKMSKNEILRQNKAINAARRKALNSKG